MGLIQGFNMIHPRCWEVCKNTSGTKNLWKNRGKTRFVMLKPVPEEQRSETISPRPKPKPPKDLQCIYLTFSNAPLPKKTRYRAQTSYVLQPSPKKKCKKLGKAAVAAPWPWGCLAKCEASCLPSSPTHLAIKVFGGVDLPLRWFCCCMVLRFGFLVLLLLFMWFYWGLSGFWVFLECF